MYASAAPIEFQKNSLRGCLNRIDAPVVRYRCRKIKVRKVCLHESGKSR